MSGSRGRRQPGRRSALCASAIARTIALTLALWPLGSRGDAAGALATTRAEWLADKRTDPLDLRIAAEADKAWTAAARGNCVVALRAAAAVLGENPFQLAALDAQARCAAAETAEPSAARRDAILRLIEQSGTGADVFHPWAVISWTEPFEFLRLTEREPLSHQIGCGRTEHVIITARDTAGATRRYYFDIHEPYRACRPGRAAESRIAKSRAQSLCDDSPVEVSAVSAALSLNYDHQPQLHNPAQLAFLHATYSKNK